MHQQCLEIAREWAEMDPNPITSEHVKKLISQALEQDSTSLSELNALFPTDGSRIEFGTAGLRAAMKPGPLGLNDMVILQTAQGLATYVLKQSDNNKTLAVVGYDHRANPLLQISSKSLAILTQAVFIQAGIDCILFQTEFIATPLVAFATKFLHADVGIMVTASHNPKLDNGFKVYWSDACQIRPPLDQEIQACILQNLKPWTLYNTGMNIKQDYPKQTGPLTCSAQDLADAYYQALCQSGLITGKAKYVGPLSPKIVYTAMHGVGTPWAKRVIETFQLPAFLSVPEQEQPDPTFPTVSFPNPEEKGALSRAFHFADIHGATIVLANDPDADRLAVAERTDSGTWTTFTGDQIGTMLGHWLWEQRGKNSTRPIAMCASTASSKMLATIAQVEGFHFEDTLTGFKWIGHCANELRKKGYHCIFAYEEAIGFCCGDVISDKDGLSALGVMCELIYYVHHQRRTLTQHLQSLYDKYGEFCCNNGYFFCYDPAVVFYIFDSIRNGGSYMTAVGPYQVESIRDLGFPGFDSSTTDKKPTLPISKSSPMITIRFTNGCVVQFRASGTEPKFKYYIEMRGRPGIPRAHVEKDLLDMSSFVLESLLHPKENNLIKP